MQRRKLRIGHAHFPPLTKSEYRVEVYKVLLNSRGLWLYVLCMTGFGFLLLPTIRQIGLEFERPIPYGLVLYLISIGGYSVVFMFGFLYFVSSSLENALGARHVEKEP